MSGTALSGLAILVPESRELDLFASMLEAEGGSVLRCPLVKILDLDDTADAERWITEAIEGRFDDIIWLTGEGLRRLLTIAARMNKGVAFAAALGRARNITRGPKPGRALREIGLAADLTAGTPTSQGVLDTLSAHDLRGRIIGVQAYPGDGPQPLLTELQARGAQLHPVTPYRYASEAQNEAVADVIQALAAGDIGLVVFTATPQVERLFQVARESGLESALQAGLARTPVAAIGPVMEATLRQHGVEPALMPQSSFHLKPMLRAIMAWRTA